MAFCWRCKEKVSQPYEHQLQDGWDCDGLASPMTYVCPNCSNTMSHARQHLKPGMGGQDIYTCQKAQGVSPGEQRIINAIGTETATGTMMFEFRALHANLNALREEMKQKTKPQPLGEDWSLLNQMLRDVTVERDDLQAEVEFLKIQVEEMKARQL